MKFFFKKTLCICLVLSFLFTQVSFSAVSAGEMSSDERLTVAYESYLKGIRDENRGDKAFSGRPGKAQRMYEHAEHYYSTAKFQYEQLGLEHSIDVIRELAECEKVYRRVHIKTANACKKTQNR